MESEQETFACPVDPFCLGMCSWTGCPGNADLASTESHELELHPPNNSPEPLPLPSTPSTTVQSEPHPLPSILSIVPVEPNPHISSGRFAAASDQELAKD